MSIEIGISDDEWKDIILRLTAFTRSWTKGKPWFRGEHTASFVEGKEVEDYVFAAIERYLENSNKYNPQKGSLLDYLKYNLIRSFVANDLRKKENTDTADIFAWDDNEDEEDSSPYSERVMPHTEALFPDDIDYRAIKAFVEDQVKGDADAENILLGIYSHGLKRREIIEEFNLSAAEYDNGMRRLNTALRQAASHFNPKKVSL